MTHHNLSEAIIGAAIEVHRQLGPGLLESVYEASLYIELRHRHIEVERQIEIPLFYKGIKLDQLLRLDLYVARQIIVEIKAVEALVPIHTPQVLTYLKLTGCRLGLIMNFNALTLRQGLKRVVNRLPEDIV